MIVSYPAAQTENQRALSQCPKTGVVKEAYRRQMMILFYSCMVALQGALFAALTFTRQPVLFVAFAFICCLTPEVVYILADSIIQANIASEYRATILSVVSMLRSLMSAVSYSVLGGILDRTGTTGLMLFLALVNFAALGCFRLILTYR